MDIDEQIDKGLEQGRALAGPPPARELIITIRSTNIDAHQTQAGYMVRADLDDPEAKAKAIAEAKTFLDEL